MDTMSKSSEGPGTETAKGSAFGKWFKAQFGRMPNADKLRKARTKCDELESALQIATMELRVEDALYASWQSALYGWNARPRGKS